MARGKVVDSNLWKRIYKILSPLGGECRLSQSLTYHISLKDGETSGAMHHRWSHHCANMTESVLTHAKMGMTSRGYLTPMNQQCRCSMSTQYLYEECYCPLRRWGKWYCGWFWNSGETSSIHEERWSNREQASQDLSIVRGQLKQVLARLTQGHMWGLVLLGSNIET